MKRAQASSPAWPTYDRQGKLTLETAPTQAAGRKRRNLSSAIPARFSLLLFSLFISAITPSPPSEEEQPFSVSLTSFGKNQTSKGEQTQLWFTLLNKGENLVENMVFKVHLPTGISFLDASVFPTTGMTTESAQVLQKDTVTTIYWPEFLLKANQSRVFNVDLRVNIFDGETLRFPAEALLSFPSSTTTPPNSGGGRRRSRSRQSTSIQEEGKNIIDRTTRRGMRTTTVVDSLVVEMNKKKPLTAEDLRERHKRKIEELNLNKKRNIKGHKSFDNCRDKTDLTVALTKCFDACHDHAADCMACGYDNATSACVCKTRKADVSASVHPQEQQQDLHQSTSMEIVDYEGFTPELSPHYAHERKGEILMFPQLISESQCQELEKYLTKIVEDNNTPRKIIEDDNSILHQIIQQELPVSGVEYTEYVTFSEETLEVTPHYDVVKANETHKILLFLDSVAGTRFWEAKAAFELDHCPLVVGGSRGTVVIFPMSLFHDSARYEPYGSTKRTLGLRITLPPFKTTVGLVASPTGR